MKRNHLLTLTILAIAFALPIVAQAQQKTLQYFRPYDQRGTNVFETTKADAQAFEGFQLYWGAAFTQQFQMIDHENVSNDADNELVDIGGGFNLATANLLLGAQLADGIQVNLVTYLSSRHHAEAWVKGGFLQVDKLPMLNSEALDNLMKYTTVRVGHMEINYGDAHFRRSDNGQAIYNPFVGNLIMDSFATEIGAEIYVQKNGLLGMVAMTDGEIKGRVDRPDDRGPSIYGKVGFDRQMNEDLRLRLTGSVYTTSSSINNTLYGGDRAGSRFYDVLVNGSGDSFTNGRVNPGQRNSVTAIQINPFVKFQGFEVHGVYETATGTHIVRSTGDESPEYTYNQIAADVLYRFLENESAYVGFRYNKVDTDTDASTDRIQVALGWFMTENVLMKINYVTQQYTDYPASSILHEGQFDGITIEGVVAF